MRFLGRPDAQIFMREVRAILVYGGSRLESSRIIPIPWRGGDLLSPHRNSVILLRGKSKSMASHSMQGAYSPPTFFLFFFHRC